MKMNHVLIFAVLAIATGGCAVGPNYQRPVVSAPTQWGTALAGGETNATVELAAWWKHFHDAELDSLISRAVQSYCAEVHEAQYWMPANVFSTNTSVSVLAQ